MALHHFSQKQQRTFFSTTAFLIFN